MKNKFLPLLLILIIAVLFAPLLRNFVREVVVIPFLYIFWIIRFIIEAIPQATLWPFFVLILFLVLAASLIGKPDLKSRKETPRPVHQGRLEQWLKLIDRAAQDDYFKWRLAQQLQKLALHTIANEKGQSVKVTRHQLRQGQLDIPPEIKAYFKASLKPLGHLGASSWLGLQKRPPSPFNLDPADIADYLETMDNE